MFSLFCVKPELLPRKLLFSSLNKYTGEADCTQEEQHHHLFAHCPGVWRRPLSGRTLNRKPPHFILDLGVNK